MTMRFSIFLVAVAVASTGMACTSEPVASDQAGTTGCSSTYAAQVAKPLVCDTGTTNGREVTTGTCGPYQAWRVFRDGTFYLVSECVYDAAGALLGTRGCTDTGCSTTGQMIDLLSCVLGPDLCATVDGGGV
jgi:hypothetical protein